MTVAGATLCADIYKNVFVRWKMNEAMLCLPLPSTRCTLMSTFATFTSTRKCDLSAIVVYKVLINVSCCSFLSVVISSCCLCVIYKQCRGLFQSVLEKKKSKGILKLGQNRSGGVVVSQKQGINDAVLFCCVQLTGSVRFYPLVTQLYLLWLNGIEFRNVVMSQQT